jgi:hypothetical protein
LYTFDADVPFHKIKSPSLIAVTAESPTRAIDKLDLPGIFPKTPFLQFIFSFSNEANTIYFAQAQIT